MAPAIVIENLKKSYGSTEAVKDVSFQVEPGEIFGLLGPNGAGKTTPFAACVPSLNLMRATLRWEESRY